MRPAHLDHHSRRLPGVGAARAWAAARQYADRLTRPPTGVTRLLTGVLGTEPAAGFSITEEARPRRVSLAGHHRFSRYELDLLVESDDTGSIVTVASRADFPGVRGRLYRTAVVGSRGHVLAVRRMLAAVAADAQSSRR